MKANGKHRVLIAGGGVAALEAALALRDLAADLVAVELLAPEQHFWYRPLSVSAPFELGEVTHFELDELARQIGASFTLGALTGIDEWRHVAYTSANKQITYDTLLVACGALPFPSIPGALTFRGPADVEVIEHVLDEIVDGDVRSVAFVIPWGAVWSLPAYELALLTAAHLRERGCRASISAGDSRGGTAAAVRATGERSRPCAARRARSEPQNRGIRRRSSQTENSNSSQTAASLADRVVALPRLQGAPLDGLPQTVDGFIPVDSHCRVHGVTDVFAAGDITSFTVKQGGIAAQQADVAAAAIAAAAGASVTPQRFQPVLRGLLLTGRAAAVSPPRGQRPTRTCAGRVVRAPLVAAGENRGPPLGAVPRVTGRYRCRRRVLVFRPAGVVPLEVELDREALEESTSSRLAFDDTYEHDGGVDELMSSNPLVVAPEDTLGEVAERLLEQGATAAAVAEYGQLIGILTAGDLVRASAMRVHPSEARARQWMTAEPVTVTASSSLTAAALLAGEYGVHHLPVVEGDRPVGMLYLDDALRQAGVPIGLGL